MTKQQPRPSRKRLIKQIKNEAGEVEQSAATAMMIASALCWWFEIKPEQIQEIVGKYLEAREEEKQRGTSNAETTE